MRRGWCHLKNWLFRRQHRQQGQQVPCPLIPAGKKWTCDLCKSSGNTGTDSNCCDACDFDICNKCLTAGRRVTPVPKRPGVYVLFVNNAQEDFEPYETFAVDIWRTLPVGTGGTAIVETVVDTDHDPRSVIVKPVVRNDGTKRQYLFGIPVKCYVGDKLTATRSGTRDGLREEFYTVNDNLVQMFFCSPNGELGKNGHWRRRCT